METKSEPIRRDKLLTVQTWAAGLWCLASIAALEIIDMLKLPVWESLKVALTVCQCVVWSGALLVAAWLVFLAVRLLTAIFRRRFSRPRLLWLAWLATPAALALVVGAAWLHSSSLSSPDLTDEEIVADFHRHKADADRLIVMTTEDSHLERVANNWFMDTSREMFEHAEPRRLSKDRWDEYRRLFRQLDLEAGINVEPAGVFFYRRTYGIEAHGYIRGFALLRKPPETVCTSPDVVTGPKEDSIRCRHIEGMWFEVTISG